MENSEPLPIQPPTLGSTELLWCRDWTKLDKEQALIQHLKDTKGLTYPPHFLRSFSHSDQKIQKILDELCENTVCHYPIPFGILPNLKLNDAYYQVPMVIEESSVVAAASKAAKFWGSRGGFHSEVLGTQKIGQVHFFWNDEETNLNFEEAFAPWHKTLMDELSPLSEQMRKRGAPPISFEIKTLPEMGANFRQLFFYFHTCDAMGANYINTHLEKAAAFLKSKFHQKVNILMSILSNYAPSCLVKAEVACEVNNEIRQMVDFEKIYQAVKLAQCDIYRAVTHNKGIFNGMDAVVLATGNDFRATEAQGHAYAARSGAYRGLTHATYDGKQFSLSITLPITVGVVGGLTKLHPLANFALDILDRPSASKLAEIIAAVGLAQNFAAMLALTTSGIQKGHMKMHLLNILNEWKATESEVAAAKTFFAEEVVSYQKVIQFLQNLRAPLQ